MDYDNDPEPRDPQAVRIVELTADLKVQHSRTDAYQRTCDAQGRKLVAIHQFLIAESIEARTGVDTEIVGLTHLTWDDSKLTAIADILKER